jgi:exodeoxyribonuclease V alpha subunit
MGEGAPIAARPPERLGRVTVLSPGGTAKERFLRSLQGPIEDRASVPSLPDAGADDFESAYLGWEMARSAPGLAPDEKRAIGALAAACVVAMRAGSTRVPVDETRLRVALAPLRATDAVPVAHAILARVRSGTATDPVRAVVGRVGERKPLVLDGEWLYPERMRVLEERFCARVRARLLAAASVRDARSVGRAIAAVSAGPPALTEEQKRAVREALGAPLALVTGGPGTGKTTIVVALLRALAWLGEPMDAVAIAAPTGKAAQRLRDAIADGLAKTPVDFVEAGLRVIAPTPQTLHRLLGWSPERGRFARHENDPLPHRVVVVDEASMVDLAMMDRLLCALSDHARLVLLGDADQLPSVEAGAVFRDLCAALRAVRLSTNLRVGRDPNARRIVAAAHAVNAGKLDAQFDDSVATRRSVGEVAFEGVEHLAAPWSSVGPALLDRWWNERIASMDDFAHRIARTYRLEAGAFDEREGAELRALFDHYARARLLCATRIRAIPTSAEAINDQLLARFRDSSPRAWRAHRSSALGPGVPIVVERNDYEHQLFNGDQGIVVRVELGGHTAGGTGGENTGAALMAVFRQGEGYQAFPIETLSHIAPSLATTVHKAQGSEFDDLVLILPEADMPLLTRELLYTGMTRARRSILLIGARDLLGRAVSRSIERHTGVAENLRISAR